MTGKYIEVNGVKHWYKTRIKDSGDIPVVILHGGPGGFVKVFEEVPGIALEEHLSVIYYEQRGCGRSNDSEDQDYEIDTLLEDLKCLIEKWGYQTVHLLGYSFGAELAIEFTLKHPEYVEKLVLQSPSDLSNFERIYRIQTKGFGEILEGTALSKFNEILVSDKPINIRYELVWSLMDINTLDQFLFRNMHHAKWNRKQWEKCDLVNTGKMAKVVNGRQREFTVVESSKIIVNEALILVGKFDKNVGLEIPKDYASNIKNSKLVIFNDSAHFPDIEELEKYVREVVWFIK